MPRLGSSICACARTCACAMACEAGGGGGAGDLAWVGAIHFKYSSVYMSIQNSLTICSPSPLVTISSEKQLFSILSIRCLYSWDMEVRKLWGYNIRGIDWNMNMTLCEISIMTDSYIDFLVGDWEWTQNQWKCKEAMKNLLQNSSKICWWLGLEGW